MSMGQIGQIGQIVLPPPAILQKRPTYVVVEEDGTSLRLVQGPGHNRRASFGEVAGGTTADLAAVCCCCPCVLVNLVVLAVYKVPKGVARKALGSKRRRRLLRKAGRKPESQVSSSDDDSELQIYHIASSAASAVSGSLVSSNLVSSTLESDKDVVELEKEMWEKFYGAGFWRSYSQRSDITELSHDQLTTMK